MAKHLAGKLSRAISDFRTIYSLVSLIEHEMEKRIIARHGLVKLDAILNISARLKNEIRDSLPSNSKNRVQKLEILIARLRNDFTGSEFETGRDAITAHALHLDLMRIVDTWGSMGEATFSVLCADLIEINDEVANFLQDYPQSTIWSLDPSWKDFWRHESNLGDPTRPRLANIYPGLATAGIVAPIPTKNRAQDATIRAAGLATFLRQVRIILQAVDRGTEVERLLAEIMVIDYFSFWELLFVSGVKNEHGQSDLSVVEHWKAERFKGASCLDLLKDKKHPDFEKWRDEVRNISAAHIDADADIWVADLNRWPMTVDDLINEALRVIEEVRICAKLDIRSDIFFIAPTYIGGPEVIGLSSQEGRFWRDG